MSKQQKTSDEIPDQTKPNKLDLVLAYSEAVTAAFKHAHVLAGLGDRAGALAVLRSAESVHFMNSFHAEAIAAIRELEKSP